MTQCKAITQAGTQCTRNAVRNGVCTQHGTPKQQQLSRSTTVTKRAKSPLKASPKRASPTKTLKLPSKRDLTKAVADALTKRYRWVPHYHTWIGLFFKMADPTRRLEIEFEKPGFKGGLYRAPKEALALRAFPTATAPILLKLELVMFGTKYLIRVPPTATLGDVLVLLHKHTGELRKIDDDKNGDGFFFDGLSFDGNNTYSVLIDL